MGLASVLLGLRDAEGDDAVTTTRIADQYVAIKERLAELEKEKQEQQEPKKEAPKEPDDPYGFYGVCG